MKTLKDFIAEVEVEHVDGTYAALYPDDDTKSNVAELIGSLELGDSAKIDDIHCTVAYSRKPIADAGEFSTSVNIVARVIGYEVLKHDTNTLVLTLESKEITDLFNKFLSKGATWDHENFKPHLSIGYNYPHNDLSNIILLAPKFKTVTFNKLIISPLELDWKETR